MSQVTNNDIIHTLIESKNHGSHLYFPEFQTVLDDIELSLDKQDSDWALHAIIQWAINLHASDVHLELHENEATIRYRIDGDLANVWNIQSSEHKIIVERMKYKSNLKLNINNVPQDWKFRYWSIWHDALVDIRVSVMPTRYWESVVCRILDSSSNVISFEGLWFVWPVKSIIQNALIKKQWMILVTGPTWSWKTTTLYTMIDVLKNPVDKIITLEDPIEYQISWILQSEINERSGYTFSMGIRSVLRHDPDIIMIGEIRDIDTANTSIQAALTGHLVLSTLHTKSSFETLERLENMWVWPFDVAASLDVIISQRLVRKVCRHCGQREKIPLRNIDANLLQRYWVSESLSQRWTWCDKCGNSWYSGRMGIFEVLQVTEEIRDAIRNSKSDIEIKKIAINNGFISLQDDARAKVLLGMTTQEECERNGIL